MKKSSLTAFHLQFKKEKLILAAEKAFNRRK